MTGRYTETVFCIYFVAVKPSKIIRDFSFSDQQEISKKLSKALNKNIGYIFEELKENSPNSEILQKIQGFTEFENLMDDEKCNVLTKIVEYLINEVVLKSKIEKALENEKTTLSEIQEMCNQKEIKIFELETEVKTLQQTITEYKTGQ